LSAGLLGVKKKRKLVPTRWAITAVDTIISKNIAKEIIHYPSIDKYYTFYGEYLDNKFIILLIPGPWAFEMNEHWHPNSIWNQDLFPNNIGDENSGDSFSGNIPVVVNDYEYEKGRKSYAGNITGAYYAARKEIIEFLYNSKRKASAIVFREIGGGYIVPLGVWVIRECVRQTMKQGWKGKKVVVHESLKDALDLIPKKFQLSQNYWLKASHLIPYLRSQRRLDYWMN